MKFIIKTTSQIIPRIEARGDNLRQAIDDSIAEIARAAIGYADPVISIIDMDISVAINRMAIHPDDDDPAYFAIDITVAPPQSAWQTAEGIWWDHKYQNRESIKRIFVVMTDDDNEA